MLRKRGLNPFKERAKHEFMSQGRKARKRNLLTPEKKHNCLLQRNIILNKILNYQLLRSAQKNITLPEALYDYKCWRIIEHLNFKLLEKYKYKKFENLEEAAKHLMDIIKKTGSLSVEYSALYFRKKMGKVKQLRNIDVFLLHKKLFKENIELSCTVYIPEINEGVEFGTMRGLAKIDWIGFKKQEKSSVHSPKTKYEFRITIDKDCVLGQLLVCGLFLGQYIFTVTDLYSLRRGIQMMIRAIYSISGKKEINLYEDELYFIAGIKDKNTTQRRETLNKYLSEAEDNGFIKQYKKENRLYKITKLSKDE